jgi:hypothetical protein
MGFWDFVKEIADASLKAGFTPDEVNKGVRPHPEGNTVQDPWGTHHYYGEYRLPSITDGFVADFTSHNEAVE